MKRSTIDLLVVLGLVLAAIPIILLFEVKPLISTVFFFVIPSTYLLVRKPKHFVRTLTGSFFIGVVLGFSFDFLATLNGAWHVPQEQLVIPLRFFGIVPADDVIWFFFWAFTIIVFYEHFLERERSERLSRNFPYFFIPALLIAVAVPTLYFVSPSALSFDYAYITLGSVAILPLIPIFFKRPQLIVKFLKLAPFFIFLFLAFELTALYLEQWMFPGQYLGYVTLFGLAIPFEEFFFWIVVSSSVVLSDYELAVDDMH